MPAAAVVPGIEQLHRRLGSVPRRGPGPGLARTASLADRSEAKAGKWQWQAGRQASRAGRASLSPRGAHCCSAPFFRDRPVLRLLAVTCAFPSIRYVQVPGRVGRMVTGEQGGRERRRTAQDCHVRTTTSIRFLAFWPEYRVRGSQRQRRSWNPAGVMLSRSPNRQGLLGARERASGCVCV